MLGYIFPLNSCNFDLEYIAALLVIFEFSGVMSIKFKVILVFFCSKTFSFWETLPSPNFWAQAHLMTVEARRKVTTE